MEIRTDRLALRELTTAFAASAHAYASDEENTRLMVHLPNRTMDETMAFLRSCEAQWASEAPSAYEFAVIEAETGEHIGGVTVFCKEGNEAELGWILRRDRQGRGYATEAARGAIAFARQKLGNCRIIACCDTENHASRRVMERLGMTLVGESGGRWNKSSQEERREYTFELKSEAGEGTEEKTHG